MNKQALKRIPGIDRWLNTEPAAALCAEFGRNDVVATMREHLDQIRARIKQGMEPPANLDSEEYFNLLRADLLKQRQDNFERVINATGIIMHTNLGRAPLAAEAMEAIQRTASGYSNLEFDTDSGKRGSRHTHVEGLLQKLTGAEAAVVVNNCAAAVVLALNTFCRDAEVIVSRGELIEIGGSFRMPDVIEQSKAQMKEVGTTNKTRLADYAAALSERTEALLTSHPSNFKISGFTSKPELAELATLAHRHGRLLIQDLGSGSLIEAEALGLAESPSVQESIRAGVDLVTFSGDKLLGGPQAGIIIGKREQVERIKRNPLLRALRIDKLSLAALNATLRLYLPPNDPLQSVPVLRMISEDATRIARRSRRLLKRILELPGIDGELVDGISFAGGGALPMNEIPTPTIRLRPEAISTAEFARRLRSGPVPVIGRIAQDKLHLNLRTVLDREAAELLQAVERALK